MSANSGFLVRGPAECICSSRSALAKARMVAGLRSCTLQRNSSWASVSKPKYLNIRNNGFINGPTVNFNAQIHEHTVSQRVRDAGRCAPFLEFSRAHHVDYLRNSRALRFVVLDHMKIQKPQRPTYKWSRSELPPATYFGSY